MTKSEPINALATQCDQSKASTEALLNALGECVTRTLQQGGEITLPGIGKLHVTERAARKGHNPQTGESIDIPARKAPGFKAVKALKDAVNRAKRLRHCAGGVCPALWPGTDEQPTSLPFNCGDR